MALVATQARDGDRPAGGALSLAAALGDGESLAAPPKPGLNVPKPELLAADDDVTLWAPVRRSVDVKSSPAPDAPAVGRLEAHTPEGTENIALVARPGREGNALWVPIRAAGVEGWVPRQALGGYESVDLRLVVDTNAFTATLLRGGNVLFRARVGVGTADAPTPTGSFYVRNKLTRFRSPFYGPLAFGTSARSETLTDWPAGGFIGIHGTNQPELLPGRVSHGCVRLRNADLLELARLMPVGTPVTIT